MKVFSEVGQAMYASSAADQGAQQAYGDTTASSDEDIVDAEVVDEGRDAGAA
jgi:hypothetical protein